MNVVALVDCNSFYASCEAIFKPQLKKQPVVVLSINDGDILVVDRSIEPKNRDIVIAILEGNLTVKRLLFKMNGSVVLKSENSAYKDIKIPESAELEVWGVVTSVIHQFIK